MYNSHFNFNDINLRLTQNKNPGFLLEVMKFSPFPGTSYTIAFNPLQDAEGVLVANIGSYMGGVDLWHNEDETYDDFDPQSMHDKILEVVSISGTWHLGKLQVTWFLLLLLCVSPIA